MSDLEKQIEEIYGEKSKKDKQFARTGCLLLDLLIGGGEGLGIRYGTGVNFVGSEGSGKSLIGNELIAAEYHLGKKNLKWMYADCENGNNFDTKTLYGVDVLGKNTFKKYPDTVENLDAQHSLFLDQLGKKDHGIYILDSLDALRDDERKERQKNRKNAYAKDKEFTDSTYGMAAAKFLSQEFFRNQMSAISEKNSILVFISQVRQNLDRFSFKKWTQVGGKSLFHWMSAVVWFSKVTKIVKNDKAIGAVVKAKIEKARHARPYRECTFVMYFDLGIDDITTNLDYLFDLRGKNGKHLSVINAIPWGSEAIKEKNADNYVEFLKNNNFHAQCKTDRKKAEGKDTLTIKFIKEWIKGNELALEKSKEVFGDTYTYEELRAKIDEDPAMKKELEKRVIGKWEKAENDIKTPYRKKYA